MSDRVDKLLRKIRMERAAKEADLPRFKCACGQEIWAEKDVASHIGCTRCFGAFREIKDPASFA
jgi:hypothetical protein